MDNAETKPERIALCMVGGRLLVGLFNGAALDPCYELQVQAGQGPGGEMLIGHHAMPVAMLPSWSRVDLPSGTPIQMVSDLSAADRAAVLQAMQIGEKMAQGIRTAQSGVLVAPASALNGPGLQRGGRR